MKISKEILRLTEFNQTKNIQKSQTSLSTNYLFDQITFLISWDLSSIICPLICLSSPKIKT